MQQVALISGMHAARGLCTVVDMFNILVASEQLANYEMKRYGIVGDDLQTKKGCLNKQTT